MEHTVNQITVRGELRQLPEFSHENHGKRFYRFYLSIQRLSGAEDIVPVIAPEALLNTIDPSGGGMLLIQGQVRSHNYREDGIRRLLIFLFATDILADDGPPMNELTIEGPICKDPIYRRTPLGREICDIMLAVPRAFHRADYLPCILWGKTAQEVSQCGIRDKIRIHGRLQSRVYTKVLESGVQERTAYEISALSAEILETE
ncbi:MAG: single-stranded DNA-binding protein [Oscillospiraceae bacterium]|nr:single-stranded DNA-binding protein [Oscillospiraceae bacterium]